MYITIEKMTPELAKKYIQHNVRNIRPIIPNVVKKYAESMKNGTFEMNGETIKFYENGDLFDGQHRLMAIIESGIPQEIIVVRGINDNITVTDVGSGRSIKCLSTSMGGSCSTSMLAGASVIYRGFEKMSKSITPKESIARYAVEHEALFKIAATLSSSGKKKGNALLKKGWAIALFYCYLRMSASNTETISKIERFSYCVNTGFYENSLETPAIVIRNYLSDNKYVGSQMCNYINLMSILDQAYNNFQKVQRKKQYVPNNNIIGFIQTIRQMDGLSIKED